MSRRVLVLTSSTGSGHDMRAKAFAQWVEACHGPAVAVRIEHIIENGSLLGRCGVWIYNTIQQHWPRLHHVYFFIVEIFVRAHAGSVSFGGNYYRKLLQEWRPDVVFSVHDSTNAGYFDDAKRILGPSVRCVTYCGEYSGGYGYSRNWVNPCADHFIARTRNAAAFAARLGLPASKISVFHRFLPPAAFAEPLAEAARQSRLETYRLDPERLTVFLATGGYGANHHLRYLKALLPLADKVQVIVVCGRNQKIHRRLQRWQQGHPQLRMHLEGLSQRVAEYLQISDAVVTRGGANTTTEAIHYGCPILYDAIGGLMPQEHCTVRYLVSRGAATLLAQPPDLTRAIRLWLEKPALLAAVRQNLTRLLHADEHPTQLLAAVLGEPATHLNKSS